MASQPIDSMSREERLEYLRLLEEQDRRRQHRGIPTATYERTDKQHEQAAMAFGPAPQCLAVGGSRSGKTFGFCEIIAERGLMAPGARQLIARQHNVDVKQSVMLDTWPKMMATAFPDVEYDMNKADQFVTLPGGSEVWFGGLDDSRIDKILGREFCLAYANECSQIGYASIVAMRSRLAQKVFCHDGRQLPIKGLYDLNPTGRSHWTYREFIEQVKPDSGLPLAKGSRAYLFMNPADNPHLPAEYHRTLDEMPDKQRQRFRDGKYLSEVPGALWSTSVRVADDGREIPGLEQLRVAEAPPLKRVVVGVDPSGSDGIGGDHQGIVVSGLGEDGHGYVLADRSCRLSPDGWARVVCQAVEDFGADCIVAERNYGGAMVESVIRSANPKARVKLVTATRGKAVRAEPIAALYERAEMHHVGVFTDMEEEMTMTTTAGYQGVGSPDRMDALVWCLTELMLGGSSYTPYWD